MKKKQEKPLDRKRGQEFTQPSDPKTEATATTGTRNRRGREEGVLPGRGAESGN